MIDNFSETFEKLKGDPNNIAANLTDYIKGFSPRALDVIEHFGFEEEIAKLDKADHIRREHEEQGFGGRFGAGLPRINDGSLLFLQHMLSKMKPPENGGTRLAIVFKQGRSGRD